MRYDSISIGGILRFERPVTLNCRDLPAGIVAFTGVNGEGKTTMLEAFLAVWYRKFLSRKKNLLDYAHGRDAFLEAVCDFEGRGLYQARLSIDSVARRGDAALSRVLPDGTLVPAIGDSKLPTYDLAVADLLPPLPFLLASVFAAQNRAGSFSKLDKKGRKDLFADLLGLGHYEAMAARCKAAAALVERRIEVQTAVHETALASLQRDSAEQIVEDGKKLDGEQAIVDNERAVLSGRVESLEAEIALLAGQRSAHAAAKARLEQLRTRHAQLLAASSSLSSQIADLKRATTVAIEREGAQQTRDVSLTQMAIDDKAEYNSEVKAIGEAYTRIVQDADLRIANNRKLLDQGETIRAAAARVEELDRQIAKLELDQDQNRAAREVPISRERILLKVHTDIQHAEQDLERVEANAALLGKVPFGEKCAEAGCQFTTSAAAARDRVPELKRFIDSNAAIDVELSTVQIAIRESVEAEEVIKGALAVARQARATQSALSAGISNLERAEEQIKGHEARKADAAIAAEDQRKVAVRREEARQARLKEQIAGRERVGQERIAEIQRDGAAKLDAHEVRYAEALKDLEAIRVDVDAATKDEADTSTAEALTILAEGRLREARERWERMVALESSVAARRDMLVRRRQTLADLRQQADTVRADIARLTLMQVDWNVFLQAFSRDGLPVIEIDAAGPTVSATCNDLLRTCGLGKFTVELITQEAKARGSEMKDVFELRVFDSSRGGKERDLDDLSGGEQVLVDEALKSAIALLVNSQNRFPMRTCWRDETTGALHPEIANEYVSMLRRVHTLGGFHQTFFITHYPEIAKQADAIVEFAGGGLRTLLPPYEN